MNPEYDQDYQDFDDESVEYYAIRPNKTQLKREIAEVMAMAEEISKLAANLVAEFALPDDIEKALLDIGKMGQNSARKRLLKYVTGQLRNLELEPVREKLDRLKNRSAHATREHHQAERWRELLLADGAGEALTQFIADYPQADSQYIRQLQRNAQKEAKESKPPKSARLLYQYVKGIISGEE